MRINLHCCFAFLALFAGIDKVKAVKLGEGFNRAFSVVPTGEFEETTGKAFFNFRGFENEEYTEKGYFEAVTYDVVEREVFIPAYENENGGGQKVAKLIEEKQYHVVSRVYHLRDGSASLGMPSGVKACSDGAFIEETTGYRVITIVKGFREFGGEIFMDEVEAADAYGAVYEGRFFGISYDKNESSESSVSVTKIVYFISSGNGVEKQKEESEKNKGKAKEAVEGASSSWVVGTGANNPIGSNDEMISWDWVAVLKSKGGFHDVEPPANGLLNFHPVHAINTEPKYKVIVDWCRQITRLLMGAACSLMLFHRAKQSLITVFEAAHLDAKTFRSGITSLITAVPAYAAKVGIYLVFVPVASVAVFTILSAALPDGISFGAPTIPSLSTAAGGIFHMLFPLEFIFSLPWIVAAGYAFIFIAQLWLTATVKTAFSAL